MICPMLYNTAETAFDTNGLGALSDALSCEATSGLDGMYELELRYPVDGVLFDEIRLRCLIRTQANQEDGPQLFRVYRISKPLSGVVTIQARHISYDLSGIPCAPFSAGSVVEALAGLNTHAVGDCPFTFWTDKSTVGPFSVSQPQSLRSCLGGVEGSILDTYRGDFAFDNFTVRLYNKRGADHGFAVRYGKNMTSLRQEENCAACFTGIYPFWRDLEGKNLVQLPEKVINAPGTYDYVRVKTVDFSPDFQEPPTEAQLREKAESYFKSHQIGVPEVSLDVAFVPSEKQEDIVFPEYTHLGDTAQVFFPALGVKAKARIVRIVYDCLGRRIKKATLGSVKANIADSIAAGQDLAHKIEHTTVLQQAAAEATSWLTNGKGYKVERRAPDGSTIDTLYMDTPDIMTAQKVLRIGQSGIGFSKTGVNGPYFSAWTLDGNFNADSIQSGSLNAALIKAGVIRSQNGRLNINLDTGNVSIDSDFGLHLSPEAVEFSRRGSEMESALNEQGLSVYRSGQPILVAGAKGVDAVDLHARNYLIVGDNSRFEDIGERRTGCFWIGGDK